MWTRSCQWASLGSEELFPVQLPLKIFYTFFVWERGNTCFIFRIQCCIQFINQKCYRLFRMPSSARIKQCRKQTITIPMQKLLANYSANTDSSRARMEERVLYKDVQYLKTRATNQSSE